MTAGIILGAIASPVLGLLLLRAVLNWIEPPSHHLCQAHVGRVRMTAAINAQLLAALRVLTAAVPNGVASYRTNDSRKLIVNALAEARAAIAAAEPAPIATGDAAGMYLAHEGMKP